MTPKWRKESEESLLTSLNLLPGWLVLSCHGPALLIFTRMHFVTEITFFKVIFSFQMTYLEVPYEQDEIWKFQKQLYYLQTNTMATRRNVTNAFCIHFRYVNVQAKRLCQSNVRECCTKEDFNQNGSLIS